MGQSKPGSDPKDKFELPWIHRLLWGIHPSEGRHYLAEVALDEVELLAGEEDGGYYPMAWEKFGGDQKAEDVYLDGEVEVLGEEGEVLDEEEEVLGEEAVQGTPDEMKGEEWEDSVEEVQTAKAKEGSVVGAEADRADVAKGESAEAGEEEADEAKEYPAEEAKADRVEVKEDPTDPGAEAGEAVDPESG